MRRLSILHTESSLGWGGQEIRVLSESQGLARRGHDVKLLCAADSRICAEAPAWQVEAVALPIATKRLAGVKALAGWFRRNRCDVVSTHSSTDAWLSALALAALGRPYPMVRTRHISAPVPRNPLSRWLYTRATARIVTAGESLRKELIERNGFPAGRIESVPTGVDAGRFRPGDRLAARDALHLPRDKTFIGIVATLRSWVHEAALGERVLFAGNQHDVLPWLQALDIFALPSYANEGVPQALLQAMLVGLPCVTTHVGSIAELATPEVTALVVPPQDVTALRAALERLIADPSLGKTLGAAARRHCAENMSYERMLERMEAVYRGVADANR